jgi:tetratricopeptide (TPR) repeat protein
MKCPFLIKRRDIFDDDGKKIDEEVELLACLKNECMVYDSATKLCSLLSSNMKTGVLIDDYKKGVKEIKEEIFQRTEALIEGVSNSIDKLQEGLGSRLDVQKKQIEVMILGFDKLQEAFKSNFEGLQASLQDASGNVGSGLTALSEANGKQMEDLRTAVISLEEKFGDLNSANMRLADDLLAGINKMGEGIKGEISGMKTHSAEVIKDVIVKFDEFRSMFSEASEAAGSRNQSLVDRLSSIDDVMKNVINELRFETSATADRLRDALGKHIEGVKSEVADLKKAQVGALNGLQGGLIQVQELFTKSSSSLDSMLEMMGKLNSNYVESLGKIAGLAEGMRKGVSEIGESMTKILNEMATETHNQMDIAKLTDRFDEIKKEVGDMAEHISDSFKDAIERQTKLSDHTQGILESMQTFLRQADERFEKEQEISKKKTALDHFDRATLYYYRGNFELALSEIEKALEIDRTAEYLNLKGLILAELGRYEDSKKSYVAALEVEPEHSELHNNLGLLYLKMKKLDEAVLSFEKSAKKNVNNALTYVNLGKALIELERYDEAIKAYHRALEIDPANQEAREAVELYKKGKIGA